MHKRGSPEQFAVKWVAGVTGLEPAASGVTGQRSNRLSYTPAARVRGQKRIALAAKALIYSTAASPVKQAFDGGLSSPHCRVRAPD